MQSEQRPGSTLAEQYGLPPSLPCPNCGRKWDLATWEPGQLACPRCEEPHIGVVLSEDPYTVAHVSRDASAELLDALRELGRLVQTNG